MARRRDGEEKAIGILAVAELAGVSRQTVTRAMNDMPGISETTKERVLEAARSLQYRPSRFGRGLVNPGARTLGLVVVDLTNSFFAEIASAVVVAAARQGWSVLVAEAAHGGEAALVELAAQVDAVVGYLWLSEAEMNKIFGSLPVVVLDTPPAEHGRAAITTDFGPGMREGLHHLVSEGRSIIAMLDFTLTGDLSPRGHTFNEELRRLRVQGGAVPCAVHSEPDMDAGVSGVDGLLSVWPNADAVVGFSDSVAIGMMKEFRRRGYRIPADVAVLGIDGLPLGRFTTPELSSLRLDMRELGEMAVRCAVGIWNGDLPPRGPEVQWLVAHSLLRRESA